MEVEKIMTRDVRTCRPSDTLDAAARIMWDNDCGCVPVVNEENAVVGIITDRDICMAAWSQDARLSELTVSSVATGDPKTCKPRDPVTTAEQIMSEQRVRRLPVVDNDRRIVGILSLNDLTRAAAQGREWKGSTPAVTPTEVAETLAQIGTPWRESELEQPRRV